MSRRLATLRQRNSGRWNGTTYKVLYIYHCNYDNNEIILIIYICNSRIVVMFLLLSLVYLSNTLTVAALQLALLYTAQISDRKIERLKH